MIRGLALLSVGVIFGMGLLVGGSLYLEAQGAPTPASICNTKLDGTGWQPTAVDTDRANNSVYVTCQRGDQTKYVTAELNVMDDVSSENQRDETRGFDDTSRDA